jgi:hypothetical protein
MTELKLSSRLAQIVVYSHIALFAYGFIIVQFGTFDGTDAIQLILMGSPLLALVGLAAFNLVMRLPPNDDTHVANPIKVQMSMIVTSIFIVGLFAAYTVPMLDTTITKASIKFWVGAIETGLGGYIGVVKDTFFAPRKP